MKEVEEFQSDVYGKWPYSWDERKKIEELAFSIEEYERRMARLYAELDAYRLDAIFIPAGESSRANVRYLSGWDSSFGDSIMLAASGRNPILITNSIFHGEPMHSNVQETWVRDFRPFLAYGATLKVRSAVDYLVDALEGWGLKGKRIGYVESRWTSARIDREIRLKLAGYEVVDVSHILGKLRRTKSPAEIEVLRKVADAASMGMEAALEVAKPGNTEHDVGAALTYGAIKAGGDISPLGMHVMAGTRSSLKNALPRFGKVIQEGEIVSIDSSLSIAGYWCDHARSTVAGEAAPEQARLFEACCQAWEAGLAATRPGGRISDVYSAMNHVVSEHGYAEWDWSLGHSFGLDITEEPIFVRENPTLLQPGDTFFLEPMIIPTSMGSSCFEDPVLVTETGATCLTFTKLRTW